MKIVVLQENLQKALNAANRFVPQKAQLPILSNFLIEAKEGKIVVFATNLETGIKIELSAKIEQDGAVIVPAKTLTELISGLPKDKIVLRLGEKRLEVECQGHRASVNVLPPQEFPPFPGGKRGKGIELTRELLREISRKVFFAASQDEARPTLTGILLVPGKKDSALVATDGFRLSLLTKRVAGVAQDDDNLILPAKVFQEVGRLVDEVGQEDEKIIVEIVKESSQAIFWGEGFALFSRVIEGKFPPYEKIIPKDFVTTILVDKENLLQAVKLASIFAREAANIIKIKTGKNSINVSGNSPQSGENSNEVEATVEGEETEVAFNSRYLLDYLNNAEKNDLTIQFSGPLSPAVFSEKDDTDSFHIIMPVRV